MNTLTEDDIVTTRTRTTRAHVSDTLTRVIARRVVHIEVPLPEAPAEVVPLHELEEHDRAAE